MQERVSNEISEFWIENGILCAQFRDGALVDLDAAKDSVRIRDGLLNGRVMPILLDIRGLRELTKGAREYLSSPECLKMTSAGVLLTNNSLFVRTLANIYFRLAQPNMPHRMFADREAALHWFEQHKRLN